MMPAQITIQNFTIHTFGIFILVGFLLLAFGVWSEGKKDGFSEEKLFDLLLLTIFSAILFSRFFYALGTATTFEALVNKIYKVWEPGYSLTGALVGSLVPLYGFCKAWKWSFYRIIDIFSLGLSLALAVVFLGYVGLQGKFEFLFAFAGWIFLFAMLSSFRNSKIKSGYVFSIFLALTAALGFIFFRDRQYLIFYGLLVTLSFVVFLFRSKLTNNDTLIERIISAVKGKTREQKS